MKREIIILVFDADNSVLSKQLNLLKSNDGITGMVHEYSNCPIAYSK